MSPPACRRRRRRRRRRRLRPVKFWEKLLGKRSCPVLYQVQLRIFSNLLHCIIVPHTSICGCFQVGIFFNFFIFVFYHCYYLEKCGLGKMLKLRLNHISNQVLIRISSNFLQWFIVSYIPLCRWLQVDIYLIILCIFICFFNNFTKKNIALEILSELFKFTTWIHYIIPIYMFLITSWYT